MNKIKLNSKVNWQKLKPKLKVKYLIYTKYKHIYIDISRYMYVYSLLREKYSFYFKLEIIS